MTEQPPPLERSLLRAIAHELRTPLATLVYATERAMDADADLAETRAALEVIARQAHRLRERLDALLGEASDAAEVPERSTSPPSGMPAGEAPETPTRGVSASRPSDALRGSDPPRALATSLAPSNEPVTPVTGVRRRIATDELPTAPPRVVIVEDDDDARWMLRLVLEAKGLHVIAEAPDGPAAVTEILEGHPDLALVDLSIPGFDGLEIARRVRALGSPTRLVALTGHGDADTRRAVHDAGFDAHLVKPLDAADLATIRRLLGDASRT